MERSAPYALIAAFVLVGLAVAAGLLIWLTDYDPGRRTARYAVVFDDVSGLSLASEVRYNGLPVGEVATMVLDPAGTGLIRVEIEVLEEVPLRKGAVARLSTQGVTGVAVVALEGGDPDAAPLPVGPTGLPMLDAGRGAVETLADEAPALLEEARVLVADLRRFATPENAQRVSNVLTDLESAAAGMGELGALAEDFGGIGRDLAPALRGLPQTLARIDSAVAEAEALAATLRSTIEGRVPGLVDRAEATLQDIGGAAEAGRNRLNEAEPLVTAATRAAEDFGRLSRESRGVIATADAALGDLSPALADLRATAQAAREIGEARLPGIADRTEAALDAATGAATEAEALAATLRGTVEARVPGLVDRAEATLQDIGGAAEAGRNRLNEAEPLVTAATRAAEDFGRLSRESRGVIATADAALGDLSPALADLRATAQAAREIGEARLPGIADRTEAALDAATGAATEAEALAATLRGTVEARVPGLVDRAEATLQDIGGAAEAGRNRLNEAEPLVAAATQAAEDFGRLSRESRGVIATADAALGDLSPALADLRAATASLTAELPPTLADLRATAQTAREIGEARLPGIADRTEAALDAATGAATEAEAQIGAIGEAARARLDESGPVLEAFAETARAVGAASSEVEAVIADVAPAVSDVAAAGARLAASAEALADRSGPLIDQAGLLIDDARTAATAATAAIRRADGVIADFERIAPGLDRALREVAVAADALARLARQIARDPSSLLTGR